ncbi:MAG: dipeptide epimerase [Oscillatoriales cyanobacterium RM2_1_1]|nr:dipeptide epimerase [Oscillatoriales cyanobacterium SM2_3_0]NJO44168.1 dipeptide epimerase [Oscillatoriales cyanobacterium RM2_1_1]
MKLQIQPFTVNKQFPLTISRGTTAQSTNLWVRLEQEGVEGWGEASPFSIGAQPQTSAALISALELLIPLLGSLHPLERQRIEQVLDHHAIPSAARAAIDLALWDWMGKRVGLPLWQLWGLNHDPMVPFSVTIGINTPEQAARRTQAWLELIDPQMLKIKLGSPAGLAADQAMFTAVQAVAPPQTGFCVDANGGWPLAAALTMAEWLAAANVKYIEQPLAPTVPLDQWAELSARSPLPIFADESCLTSPDIPRLAAVVQGVNIKLMKSGGLGEARRMIHTAKAHGLQVMLGCYSDSALANTAAAHLSSLADYLDLDSHLNLVDDPFQGANIQNGRLLPPALPGLGVGLRVESEKAL